MENRIPPYDQCESCYYWRSTSANGSFSWKACHYCYETGELRDKGGDQCKSFVDRDEIEHMWRREYAKKQNERE